MTLGLDTRNSSELFDLYQLENVEYLNDLSEQICSLLSIIRLNHKKISDGNTHYQISRETQGVTIKAIIGIRTKGCTFAKASYKGCSICGHISSSLWNDNLTNEIVLDDFKKSLNEVANKSPKTICLYTSGSFLDEEELPIDLRREILTEVNKLKSVDTIIIESVPSFISEDSLGELQSYLDGKQIRIGIGIDSSNDLIRNIIYQRHFALSDYINSVDLCRKEGIDTIAYVVFGHPLISMADAISLTSESIKRAFEIGFTHVSIEPLAIQHSTLQYEFWKKGLYEIPNLWDLVCLLKRTKQLFEENANNIFLGGQVFTPIPVKTIHACNNCVKKAIAETHFVPISFWNELPIYANGKCCKTFKPEIINRVCNLDSLLLNATRLINKYYDLIKAK